MTTLVDGEILLIRRLEAHMGLAEESVLYLIPTREALAGPFPHRGTPARPRHSARTTPDAFVRFSGPADGCFAVIRDLAAFASEVAASNQRLIDEVGSAGDTGTPGLTSVALCRTI